ELLPRGDPVTLHAVELLHGDLDAHLLELVHDVGGQVDVGGDGPRVRLESEGIRRTEAGLREKLARGGLAPVRLAQDLRQSGLLESPRAVRFRRERSARNAGPLEDALAVTLPV